MKTLLLLLLPAIAYAQSWSGIIDSSRAIDWSAAGVPGGIPNRPVCTTVSLTAGSGAGASNEGAIENAINSCPEGQAVALPAGTWYVNGINFNSNNNKTVRGAGSNSTFLLLNGNHTSCSGLFSGVCMAAPHIVDDPGNVCTWSAGYAKGTTTVNLGSCSVGAIGNLKVGNLLTFDQTDEASDTGQVWNCLVTGTCSNNGGGGYARGGNRSQNQVVKVASCDGNSTDGHACSSGTGITITPGLYMANWSGSKTPEAWFANDIRKGDGIENFSLDISQSGVDGIVALNCYGCYIKGISSLKAGRNHILFASTAHSTVESSYLWENNSHGSTSYGMELNNSCDNVIQNNIAQMITDSLPNNNGGACGNVMAYNFGARTAYGEPSQSDWFQAMFYQHASGDQLNLWEGNIGNGYNADNVHGTHHLNTLFRNYLSGWQNTCSGGRACYWQTQSIQLYASSRYYNLIGNVLGTPGYHTNYDCQAPANLASDARLHTIYALGYTDGTCGTQPVNGTGFCQTASCATHGSADPLTPAYLFRWGNYDVVSAGTYPNGRFLSAEVPTTISPYANTVPASQTLPASLYLPSKPSWWGSLTWPAVGPDVTTGTVSYNASGWTNAGGSALGGHVAMTPAMNMYLNVMGGAAAGTGAAPLAFNSSLYYTSGTAPTISTASPLPSGTVGVPYSQLVSATGDATITWTRTVGSLPPPLTGCNSVTGATCTISGTPTTAGTYGFTLQAANSTGSDTKALQIVIDAAPVAPTITTSCPLATGTVGVAYSQQMTATGDAPITWDLSAGAFPTPLSMTIGGLITGTPNSAGTANFTLRAINATGSNTRSCSMTVNPAPAPAVSLDFTSHNFGSQMVGVQSAGFDVTLTNSGTGLLTITSITSSGDFSNTTNCPVSPSKLGIGASCTITSKFLPTATGPRLGATTIVDDAAGSPQVISLSGTGMPALTGSIWSGVLGGAAVIQ